MSRHLPVDDELEVQARRDYIAQFALMDTSEDVMGFKWPTQVFFDNHAEIEEVERWVPMDHPPITGVAPPVFFPVAHLRKNAITPVGSDLFAVSVAAGRTGSGTPGFTGFGLTRNKPRVFADGHFFSVGSKADPLPPSASATMAAPAHPREELKPPVSKAPTRVARLTPLAASSTGRVSDVSGNSLESVISFTKFMQSLGLKAKKKEEEDHWKDVFRACLPEGSPDPFVKLEDREEAEPFRANHGGARSVRSSRRQSVRSSTSNRSSVTAATAARALARALAEDAAQQKVSAKDLVRVVTECTLAPEGSGDNAQGASVVGVAVGRSAALRVLREHPALQEALMELELPNAGGEEDEEDKAERSGDKQEKGGEEEAGGGSLRMLGREEWIIYCEALQDLTNWNQQLI
mmetsp:Transcript_28085/g.57621  ORF Transcript_28085/g.57621 Transcript_28085/m.57621 type:complete len:406 (-) Transcript_28085:191-1408(-)